MRTFRDSTIPAAIPLDGCDGVLLYVNGEFRATAAQTQRFTKAGLQVAHIDVNGSAPELAAILDVERFDASPAQAPDWIRKRNAFGDAVVYISLDSVPGLLAATSRLTETWRIWVAHFNNVPELPRLDLPANVKLLGVQYLSTDSYDQSIITDDTWHRAPERKTA